MRFDTGIAFDFTGSAITSLAPGQRVLIVEDIAAFSFRYGSDHPVAGQYAGKLSNSGETLTYLNSLGDPIRSFAYADTSPWPSAADGTGAALVLIAPDTLPDHALAANWQASNYIGGSPGQIDAATSSYSIWAIATGAEEPSDDSDDDGFIDLIEYALGSDPLSKGSLPQFTSRISNLSTAAGSNDYLTLTFTHQNTDPDLSVNAQESSTLDSWNFAILHSRIYHSDGTATSTYRNANPTSDQTSGFIRAYFESTSP